MGRTKCKDGKMIQSGGKRFNVEPNIDEVLDIKMPFIIWLGIDKKKQWIFNQKICQRNTALHGIIKMCMLHRHIIQSIHAC